MASAAKPVPAGDVVALIAAINAANANGEDNTIILEAGTYLESGTYLLTAVDNVTDGATGLPSMPSRLAIIGS
jgi:hypothetical protein